MLTVVLMAGGEAISYGTIIPFSLPKSTAVVNFRTNAWKYIDISVAGLVTIAASCE